jgi:O-methyltransferase involved in polyketide biosynthesis
MARAAAKTALMPTVLVAAEQWFPNEQRIVDDGLSYSMLPFGAKMFVRLLRLRWLRYWVIRKVDRSDPGIWVDCYAGSDTLTRHSRMRAARWGQSSI